MERKKNALFLVCQFLEEQGYPQSLKKLVAESGFDYGTESKSVSFASGALMSLIDDDLADGKVCKEKSLMLPVGDGCFANEEYCCLSGFAAGANTITAKLRCDGVLVSACSGRQLYVFELGNDIRKSSSGVVPKSFDHHSAAVLTIDFHPSNKNLFLTGGMDKMVCLWSLQSPISPISSYKSHSKYVVRVKWSPSGKYFATASYDKTVCIYSQNERDGEADYSLIQRLQHPGCVEAICFKKDEDVLLVAVRDDNRLWIYDLTQANNCECTFLNMNAYGDDYVSFTAMDLSLSPDGQYLLVTTDQHRVILFDLCKGDQIGNYYGVLNDEYSQPRTCWHPSGRYFYTTSDDKSICVFELSSCKIVKKLKGHTGRVRDISFCSELSILVSSGYDSTLRFWKHNKEAK